MAVEFFAVAEPLVWIKFHGRRGSCSLGPVWKPAWQPLAIHLGAVDRIPIQFSLCGYSLSSMANNDRRESHEKEISSEQIASHELLIVD